MWYTDSTLISAMCAASQWLCSRSCAMPQPVTAAGCPTLAYTHAGLCQHGFVKISALQLPPSQLGQSR